MLHVKIVYLFIQILTVNTKTFDKIYRNSAVGSFREQR